jgi:hypothetical protein
MDGVLGVGGFLCLGYRNYILVIVFLMGIPWSELVDEDGNILVQESLRVPAVVLNDDMFAVFVDCDVGWRGDY